jgi:hypothetical protein
MSRKLQRPFDSSPLDFASWHDRWCGPDRGLLGCWERGRRLREEEPELARRAKQGELVRLCWKGGTEHLDDNEKTAGKKPKPSNLDGTLNYLATWQGLRGEDLNIDLDATVMIVCSKKKRAVTFCGLRQMRLI